jgi:uncharacterized membrane protein
MADPKTMLIMPGKKFSVTRLVKQAAQVAAGVALSAGAIGVVMMVNGLLSGRGTTQQLLNVWMAFIKRGDIFATMALTAIMTVGFVYWQRDKERGR